MAYVYFEEEPGRRAAAGCSRAMRLGGFAANIAKLPELVKRPHYSPPLRSRL